MIRVRLEDIKTVIEKYTLITLSARSTYLS